VATPDQVLERTREQGLRDLEAFLRIPSVSSQPEHAESVRRAAAHLAEQYERTGLEHAQVLPTAGHPVVYADWLRAPGKPTILVYGHYDVQPVDPLEGWVSPPFEPAQRDGQLFARGASDDKGQIAIHWQAIGALMEATGELPLNVKLIAEGEEEIGSPHFLEFVQSHRERLRADACLVSDTAMAARGFPAITYGLRGLIYFELRVETATTDLHSGSYGGIAPNPVQALSDILARLKDAQGRVLIPGFYDGVRPLTEEERRQFQRAPFDQAHVRSSFGLETIWGEPGFSPHERTWGRPSLDVNGIWGGYQGPGSKTIIPALAAAKLSCRLVPDQNPARVGAALTRFIRSVAPAYARVTVEPLGGPVQPWITPIGHPLMQAAQRALTRVYGVEPVFIRAGGSIGAVEAMTQTLEAPCLLVGFVLPDSGAHAPNERLDLESFELGRRAAVSLWEELAGYSATKR